MALEISGKVKLILSEQTGTGKNGQWSKQDFVIETEEQFPRKVCFSAWGEKLSMVKALKPEALVKVSFNVESREFNGKWYTDLRVWKIEPQDQAGRPAAQPGNFPDAGLEPLSAEDSEGAADNDLPF
jgi:hypothetical protein